MGPHANGREEDELLAAQVDAAAAALGLRIAGEHRAAVIGYYRLAASMARTVMAVPLTPADESGSVFVPVSPTEPEDRP